MQLHILLAVFTSATLAKDIYSGTCYYEDETVFEVGYAPRPMNGAERNEMRMYGIQWQQYGEQRRLIPKGQSQTPVLPCLCHNCS